MNHRLTVVGPVILGPVPNVFVYFNKYIDSTYYMLGTVLSALQIIIHLALITSLEAGTNIIPTDDDIKAHSITNLLRVLTASK